jgi:OsmC-like protein
MPPLPGDVHRWSVRVSATGKDGVRVFARKHQFTVGAPVTFDEEYGEISGIEYVLGTVGAELVHGLVSLGRRRRLAIDHAEALVQGELDDALAYVGVVGATGHAGLAKVAVKVYVSSVDDEAAVSKLWDEVLERSPLVRTLRSAVRFELGFKVSI